ncbi:breast cancer type 1 susceptibility protein homolog isoform X4 [Pristis pectinata]|uniref:breast cancer type 1 susceptibility protein homolog isoform X4 n=1 Tax=Pristis pectinata TaxID=685728 RepID=UPI00223E612F|nr:breast cancer type 1 susceptibility protein homolog isoform X4 [Pristis pectinata]
MSFCTSEIEHVHKVLSLMLKNLECPICLELMKEPVSTKCDHQFCRFCILKLFGKKKSSIQCPLCKNKLTKRSLQESTQFKQLAEGIVRTIRAFELDTGYEFSIGDAQKTIPAEVNSYRQLWKDDDSAQCNNTPQKIVAAGVSKCRTLNVCTDPPLTEFVRKASTRNKRQKIDVAPAYVEIDSDSSDEPLFGAHVKEKSTLQQKTVKKKTTSEEEKADQCDNDEKGSEEKKSKISKPVLEELFSSEMDDNEVSEDTANTDAGDYSCATESVAGLKQMTENKSESSFCSPEAPREMHGSPVDNVNEKIMHHAAKMVNTENCTDGKELFTDSPVPLPLENNMLKKDLEILDNQEDVNQKDSNWVVGDKTDFQKDRNESSCSSAPKVSKRKSQRIIRKVSEWLSKINVDEVSRLGAESNPCDQNTESDSLAEKESHFASCEEASSSDDTEKVEYDPLASPLKDDRNVTKALVTGVENKVFGKTYKRDKRKSAPVNWSFRSESKSDDVQAHREPDFEISCNKTQKRKTRSNGLYPEDFIKTPVNDGYHVDGVWNANIQIDQEHVLVPQIIETETNEGLREEPSDSKEKDKPIIATPVEAAVYSEMVETGHLVEDCMQNLQQPDLKVAKADAESKKNMNKGKKSSAKQTKKRSKPLQLVNHLGTPSPRSSPTDMNENKIDSFPSSEEPVKTELEMRTTRRSSRLKLLDEKLIMEGKNMSKKTELTRLHSQLGTGVDVAPSEQSVENTDIDVCVETESLTMQDIIAQTRSEQLSNVNCSNEKFAASCGNCVVEKLEDGAAFGLSGDVEEQLMVCDKTAETGNATLLAKHPLSSNHSPVTIASGTYSQDSGTEASVLLLAPQHVPEREHNGQNLHSSCTEVGKLSSNDTTFLSGNQSKVATMSSEESSGEKVSTKQTRLKETAGDSEVDTEQLLKSFKSAKRRSFILLPAAGRRSVEGGCRAAPTSQGESAGKSKEIDKGAAVNRKNDRNFVTHQKTGKVNFDKTASGIKETLVANEAKAKQCSRELDNDVQQMNRADQDSVEIVPPTASLPLPSVFPEHGQQMVPLSSRTKGKRNNRLLGKKGSKSSSLASTEKEEFDSDRSSQTGKHLSSNTNNNSCLKATNPVKGRLIDQAVQQSVLDPELESNVHPEMELFSAGDQFEEIEKDIYQKRESDKLLRDKEFYENSELPQRVSKDVESELVKLADGASYHSQFVFPNADESNAAGNKVGETLQMISATPDELFDSAKPSFHKNIAKNAVNELDEMQNECEMREDRTQLKPDKEMAEELNGSLQSYSQEAGKVPDYDSDASHTGDSFSPECEFLTTQQKNAMQNNIKKLEHEMAVLEAVLDQHGSQDTQHLLLVNHQEDCPESLQRDQKTNSSLIEKVTAAFPLVDAEILQTKSKCLPATEALRPQQQLNTSITFTHGDKEETECLKPVMDLEIGQIPERFQEVNGLLHQFQSEASSQGEMKEPSSAERKKEMKEQVDLESEVDVSAGNEKLLKDITLIQKLDDEGKEECVLVPEERVSIWSPRIALQHTQGVAGSLSLPPFQTKKTNRKAMSKSFKQNRSSRASSPVFNKISKSKSTITTVQRKMSFVASGLNKCEIQLVEAFARKMGAEFRSNFSPSTTHVIMKTDADFVCERTLKYFMGIAGRRWVVSYQWIIECFRDGSIIDELEFEVRGDVINGRNHGGPRKARKTVDGKLLLSHYEICCYGSFTGMSRDQLEWMIELCGASIIKEPYLFTYSPNCTEVVVVQPDANPINTDYRAIERQYNSTVVSREWILDSIACYERHQLKAYQICLPD